MSDQNPIINLSKLLSSPLLTGTSSEPTTGSTSSFFSTDSISASPNASPSGSGVIATIPVLQPGRISISDFSHAVVTSLNNFKKSADATDQTNDRLATEQWYDASDLANLMIKVRTTTLQLLGTEDTFFQQEEQQLLDYTNGGLATYNGVLDNATTATNAMYTAQVEYNNGSITAAQYSVIANNWNNNVVTPLNNSIQSGYTAYVTATNQLNSQITANNTTINQINTKRQNEGIAAQIPPEQPVTLVTPAPAILPMVNPSPTVPFPTTVPAGFADVPNPPISVVSTSVNVTPTSPGEAAFLTTLQGYFDGINNPPSGAGYLLDNELAKVATTIAAMKLAGDPFSAYQAYATSENSTLTSLGNAYIAAVNHFNINVLPGINATITANYPNIPTQQAIPVPALSDILLPTTPPNPPTANFYPNVSLIVPVTPSGSITPTSSASYLEAFYNNVFASDLALLNSFIKTITQAQAYLEFKVYNIRGLSNVETGYIAKNKVAPNKTTTFEGAGTGAALTTNIDGLDSPAITSILSGSILSGAQLNTKRANLPQNIHLHLTANTMRALQNASLYSALPAAALLPNVIPAGTASKAALALTFLNSVSNLAASGAPANSVVAALEAAGVSEDGKAKVAGPLTSGLQLGLLLTGLFQVANALGLPGLIAQVIGNSAAGSEVNQSLASTTGYGLNDVLQNSVSVSLLKQKLVDAVVGQGTWSASTAQKLIDSAVNKIVGKSEFVNNIEFATNLVRGFKAIGLDDATTAKLTDISQDFVRSEQLNQDLDTAYVQQSVNEQSINNALFQKQDVQAALNTIAANQADQAQSDQNATYTLRDFRDDLITQLQVQGDNLKTSRQTADAVLDSIRSDQLKNSFNSQNINSVQLNSSLVYALLAHGAPSTAAQTTADAVTKGVISKQLNAEVLARENIYNSLIASGIAAKTAADISAKSALLLDNVNALKDTRASQILDQQTLAETLNTEIKNRLKKTIGIADATKIANQIVLTILGSATAAPSITPTTAAPAAPNAVTENDVVTDQVARPSSVLNQINSSIKDLKKANKEKAIEQLAAIFRAYRSPNVDLFALMARVRDPGERLQFVGLLPYGIEGNVKIPILI